MNHSQLEPMWSGKPERRNHRRNDSAELARAWSEFRKASTGFKLKQKQLDQREHDLLVMFAVGLVCWVIVFLYGFTAHARIV